MLPTCLQLRVNEVTRQLSIGMSAQGLKPEYLEKARKPVPEERMDTQAKINPEPCKQTQCCCLVLGASSKPVLLTQQQNVQVLTLKTKHSVQVICHKISSDGALCFRCLCYMFILQFI